MSFRPRPQFLNLGVGRPRLGARGGQTNDLFSQLIIPTRPPPPTTTTTTTTTTIHSSSRAFTRKSRLSTTSTPPLSHRHHHHHHHRPRSQPHNNSSPYRQHQHQQTRHNSTNSNPNNPNPNANPNDARINRLLTRLPRFLHPYLSSLRSSPSSFIVAFLILHEITAVVPGLGFFYLFHYCGDGEEEEENKEGLAYGKRFERWVMGWMMEHGYSEVMMSKMEGFERWFRRKGYFGFGKGEEGLEEEGKKSERDEAEEEEEAQKEQVLMKKWQSGDEKYRVLVDAALAYAITKALLPVRIIVSVQATPWFAGVLGRVRRVFGGGLRK